MTNNPADFEHQNIEDEVRTACKFIQNETISPLSWIFPATNMCVSCLIITGGHPEIMANYCPRVIERLSEQTEQVETEDQSY